MIPIVGGVLLGGFLIAWLGALLVGLIALIAGIVFTVQYKRTLKSWQRMAYIVCYVCASLCFLFAAGIILFFQLL
jgi:asparagine N-glycosylation enzyme membrane subunit Stt3